MEIRTEERTPFCGFKVPSEKKSHLPTRDAATSLDRPALKREPRLNFCAGLYRSTERPREIGRLEFDSVGNQLSGRGSKAGALRE